MTTFVKKDISVSSSDVKRWALQCPVSGLYVISDIIYFFNFKQKEMQGFIYDDIFSVSHFIKNACVQFLLHFLAINVFRLQRLHVFRVYVSVWADDVSLLSTCLYLFDSAALCNMNSQVTLTTVSPVLLSKVCRSNINVTFRVETIWLCVPPSLLTVFLFGFSSEDLLVTQTCCWHAAHIQKPFAFAPKVKGYD